MLSNFDSQMMPTATLSDYTPLLVSVLIWLFPPPWLHHAICLCYCFSCDPVSNLVSEVSPIICTLCNTLIHFSICVYRVSLLFWEVLLCILVSLSPSLVFVFHVFLSSMFWPLPVWPITDYGHWSDHALTVLQLSLQKMVVISWWSLNKAHMEHMHLSCPFIYSHM